MHDLDLPRLALYSLWSGNATQDVGWVRYALDKFEVPYDLIYKERVKKGDLKGAYDVIVIPNQARQRQAHGVRHRGAWPADRIQEERRVQEPRHVRRIGRHHRRHGPRGRCGVREVRQGRRPARDARPGELLPGGFRPRAQGRRGAHLRTVLRAGRDHRRRDPAAGAPDLLRLRQEDDPGALRRAVRCSASRPAPTRSSRRRPARRRCRKGC